MYLHPSYEHAGFFLMSPESLEPHLQVQFKQLGNPFSLFLRLKPAFWELIEQEELPPLDLLQFLYHLQPIHVFHESGFKDDSLTDLVNKEPPLLKEIPL
jgi:hypothetical protein